MPYFFSYTFFPYIFNRKDFLFLLLNLIKKTPFGKSILEEFFGDFGGRFPARPAAPGRALRGFIASLCYATAAP
ncbi:MAG: hypothetical protein J5700_03065, partial [Treponema sp.]|nr:hypothetical protein [Treponema sp.]